MDLSYKPSVHSYVSVIEVGSTRVTIKSGDKSIVGRISSYRLPKKPRDAAHVFGAIARQASKDGFDANSLSDLEGKKGFRLSIREHLYSWERELRGVR